MRLKIRKIKAEENTLDYKFVQADLPEVIQLRVIPREIQEYPGVYSRYHSKVFLPSSSNKRRKNRTHQLQFKGQQARCVHRENVYVSVKK